MGLLLLIGQQITVIPRIRYRPKENRDCSNIKSVRLLFKIAFEPHRDVNLLEKSSPCTYRRPDCEDPVTNTLGMSDELGPGTRWS